MRNIIIMLCSTLLLTWGAKAQTTWGEWQTMLYDRNQGIVYTLNDDIQGEEIRLPGPNNTGEAALPRWVATSRDGSRLAYMVYDQPRGNGPMAANNVPVNGNLMIYNRETGQADTYPFNSILFHMLDYQPSSLVFGPNNEELAVSYRQPDGWYIAILNTATRAYSDRLLYEGDVNLTGAPGLYREPLPVVTSYNGRDIEFVVIPAEALEAPAVVNSYVWNTDTDELTPTVRFDGLNYDILPQTNETIQAAFDEAYPINPNIGSQYANTLRVSTDYTQRSVFFASGSTRLSRPAFAQNGQQVVFQAVAPAGTTFSSSWQAVQRAGGPPQTLLAPMPDGTTLDVHDLAGTQNGVLMAVDGPQSAEMFGIQNFGNTNIIYINLQGNSAPAPEFVNSIQAGRLQFIWTDYPRSLPPGGYAAWASFAPGDAETAPPTNAGQATLTPGGEATVFTTEGDPLNVRSAPGTNFSIVARVNSGATVQLLEGPVDEGGFSWWRVRTPNGIEGWAVEQADNVRTLQAAAPGTVTGGIPTVVPGGLFVGGEAIVQVGPGGAANLREQPSTRSTVLIILGDNTPLDIIGGPVQAEDFTWWQVQTSGGVIGWVAEVVNNETVIEPIG